jgi:hypothetical protein
MYFEQKIVYNLISNQINKKISYHFELLYNDTNLNIPNDTELVLLNHSFGNNNTLQQYNLLKEKAQDKDFILLTSNYYFYKNKHKHIIYFPFYYYYMFSLSENLKKFDLQKFRRYPIMCFNLNPWLHRTINFLQMSKKNWFNRCKCSFHWTYEKEHYNTVNIGLDTLSSLSNEQKLELKKFSFPIIVENNWKLGGEYYVSNSSELYEETYINYVTENSVEQEFITEKTWKPIFSGQLFYILGSKKIIQHLKDLGIDVFDDILSHGYDDEIDLNKKIDIILDDIDKIMQVDLEKLWSETYLRRKANLDLMYNEDFQKLLVADLIKRVS